MSAAPFGARDAREWFHLAQRHLRMGFRLGRDGFPDGAVFHAYHADECVLSALIAATGYPVPPAGMTRRGHTRWYGSPRGGFPDPGSHKARIILFDEVADRTKPYWTMHGSLKRFLTSLDRLDALYYDPGQNVSPRLTFSATDAADLLDLVGTFARAVRPAIP